MNNRQSSQRFVFMLFFQLFVAIGLPSLAVAQGEGARAYQLVPENTQAVSQFIMAMRGNNTPSNGLIVQGSEIDIDLGVTQYSRTFDINGHQAGLLVVAPYGSVSGSLSTSAGTLTGRDSGLGDVMLGFIYGIYGSPNLSPEDYVKYDPGFSMALLARATMPTGSYDSANNLNMGGNRWVLELGLPMMYFVGSSFLDPNLMSFEVLPKVSFYSANTDAPGATRRLTQDPLLSVEGHITRNFGQVFWGSLDALYEYGGETTSDGISNNNRQRSLSVGATAAMNLNQSSSMKLTYGKVVSGNAAGSDGKMLRLQFLHLF
jgi:outer membrane putative beta-barrel porin/alpha-amylase